MRTFQKGSALVILVMAASLLATAASAFARSGSTAATTVTVTAGKPAEFGLKLSKKTVAKGIVTFKVMNMGTISHDFKILGKKTPLLKPGKSATLKVTFKKAGKYPYLCTVVGHAAGGMKGVLTVK